MVYRFEFVLQVDSRSAERLSQWLSWLLSIVYRYPVAVAFLVEEVEDEE